VAPQTAGASVRVYDQTNHETVEPEPDGTYHLRCWHSYRLHCSEDPRLPSSAGSCFQPSDGSEWIAEANFGDFIGTLPLLGRTFSISSRKIDEAGFSRLLEEVTRRAAALPFASRAPTLLPFEPASLSEPTVLYHAFVYLRWALTRARPTLDESFQTIAHDPHRALVREERTSALWDARAISVSSLESAVACRAEWHTVPVGNVLARSPLATAVAAVTGRPQVPLSIVEPIVRSTRDTPENRFVRYSLGVALEIVRRVEGLLIASRESYGWTDERLLEDAGHMRRQLRRLSQAGFLADVGDMQHFPANSQVLQRRQGYRDVLGHYCALIAASRLSVLGADMTRLMETKTASTLYEYWCFFRLADELEQMLGKPRRADKSIVADDWQASVREGITIDFPGDVGLAYNRSYGGNMSGSYSVTLRPDITMTVRNELHLLDAKFRLQSIGATTTDFGAADDETQAIDLRKWTTFQPSDIHKMHAYKDALGARRLQARQEVRSVWVLYPGDATAFFSETGGRVGVVPHRREDMIGVGALPMQPDREPMELRRALETMLTDQ
jgi:hypothetical protein